MLMLDSQAIHRNCCARETRMGGHAHEYGHEHEDVTRTYTKYAHNCDGSYAYAYAQSFLHSCFYAYSHS